MERVPRPLTLRELVRRRPRRVAAELAWRWTYAWGPPRLSRTREQWARLSNPHATMRLGEGVRLGPGFSLHAPYGGTLEVGAGTELRRGFRVELAGPDARLVIGRSCVFTYDAVVQCSTSIEVGDRCQFGQALLIVDGNHRFRDLDTPMLQQGYDFRPIRIGDDATVLTKCTIVADLGERAMVGANSVVIRPVPAFTVVGGVPARELEYFGPPREG